MKDAQPYRLVLASASPARAALLRAAGYRFDQVPTGSPEPPPEPGTGGAAYASALARGKARAALGHHPDAIVLAADTVVELDGRLIGKPADIEDAVSILVRLAGRTHRIVTALCVAGPRAAGEPALHADTAEAFVTLRNWDEARIRAHVREAHPLGRAGAYALQGEGVALVARIEGDPTTVVGLPLDLADRLIRQAAGLDPGRRPGTS